MWSIRTIEDRADIAVLEPCLQAHRMVDFPIQNEVSPQVSPQTTRVSRGRIRSVLFPPHKIQYSDPAVTTLGRFCWTHNPLVQGSGPCGPIEYLLSVIGSARCIEL